MEEKQIDKNKFLYEISKLHYIDKISQKKLSKIYDVSTATISRSLKEAEDLNIVKIEVNDISGSKEKIEKDIERKYKLEKVLVSFTPNENEETIKNIIGKDAAMFIDKIIESNMKIGIAWGSSIYEMVKFLKQKYLENLKVVDLIGSVGKLYNNVNASELARTFARNYNGENYILNSLAILSNKRTRDLLLEEKEIRDVLNMCKQLDMAIVSIGKVDQSSAVLESLNLKDGFLENICSKGAVGDICLRFFDVGGNEISSGIDDQIIGITLKDFKNIQYRLCISGGLKKFDGIKAAVSSGLINILVTDILVAKKLLGENEKETRFGDLNEFNGN
ncbi:MAG: sugar-binding transcriptional regulator [Candidatus Humimicrobiaceae bacterium]